MRAIAGGATLLRPICLAALLVTGLWRVPAALVPAASAQVSTDDHALDQLAPTPPGPAATIKPAARPAAKRPVRRAHPALPARRLTTPTMPVLPPANPVIAPAPFVMPPHAPPAAPPVPVNPTAQGTASPIPGGTRITFGPGTADLNSATLAALQAIGAQAVATPTMIVSVTGWSPGMPDDPSTARRLSLDRALAARAVLIRAGLLSDRIRTVAKGMADTGGAPADRVDVITVK